MDWELKMPHPWEFADMEQNADPRGGIGPGPMLGQDGGGLAIQTSGGSGRLDCSVDLKLGGLGDFGGPAEKWKEQNHHHHQHGASTASSSQSPSGSSKRARALSNSSQNVACLVDGCKADLSGCREYHRRHKVCEVHSKTPIVLVGGQEQRFCQQCSRFHSLVEFDEVKRSCRKRLDGHNRRRRKPQPDSMNSGSLFTNHQGSRYSSYPQIFPSAASDSPWPVIVKTEEEPLYPHQPPVHFLDHQHHHFSSSFPRSFKEGKHFPFLQDSDRATLESSICQPLLKSISSAESSSSNKIFSSGLTQVLDSDCALSLLSSPPQTSSINLGQIVPSADRIPMGQPLLPYGGGLGLGRYSGSHQASNHVSTTIAFSCSAMEDEHVGSAVLVSDGSDPEMNCQGLFAVGGEGSSDAGTQALPFSWH